MPSAKTIGRVEANKRLSHEVVRNIGASSRFSAKGLCGGANIDIRGPTSYGARANRGQMKSPEFVRSSRK